MNSGTAYLEHLTEADLSLLGPVVDSPPAEDASAYLRSHPELVEEALGSPAAFELVLGGEVDHELLVHASPFLVFAVAVHRTVDELGRTAFVEERITPRLRVPVFDAGQLREFGVDPARRYFMVEHLTSYTRVMSGPVWTECRGRWRRQRFSELDAARLAATLDAVPESDRPGIYRRLGDLALFLTGVFPDHSAGRAVHPIELERLLRAQGHDVIAVGERADLRGRADRVHFASLPDQQRAIVTRDLGDFRPLLAEAVRRGTPTYGIVCVPNRFSLNRAHIGR